MVYHPELIVESAGLAHLKVFIGDYHVVVEITSNGTELLLSYKNEWIIEFLLGQLGPCYQDPRAAVYNWFNDYNLRWITCKVDNIQIVARKTTKNQTKIKLTRMCEDGLDQHCEYTFLIPDQMPPILQP